MAKTDVLRWPPVVFRWLIELVAVAVFVVAVYEAVVAGALALWPNLTDSWILLLWIIAATISGLGLTQVRRLTGAGVRRLWPASAAPSAALAAITAATDVAAPTGTVLDDVASLLVAGTGAPAAEVWIAEPDAGLRRGGSCPRSDGDDGPNVSTVDDLDVPGASHVVPVSDADGVLGALVLRTDSHGELTTADRRLAADAANTVALLLRNRKLATDLEAALDREREQVEKLARSRRRLVLARDVARERLGAEIKRRVEETLAGCAEEVDVLIGAPETETGARKEILDRLTVRVNTAVSDFREIVHGFYPAALSDHGLGPTVGNLVAELPWPASCHAPDLPRLDQQVEMGVYFCLATLIGHLRDRAEHLTVDLALGDDTARATLVATMVVGTEGTGSPEIDAEDIEAVGDRVNALAGTLAIAAEPGLLRVTITVPLEPERS